MTLRFQEYGANLYNTEGVKSRLLRKVIDFIFVVVVVVDVVLVNIVVVVVRVVVVDEAVVAAAQQIKAVGVAGCRVGSAAAVGPVL